MLIPSSVTIKPNTQAISPCPQKQRSLFAVQLHGQVRSSLRSQALFDHLFQITEVWAQPIMKYFTDLFIFLKKDMGEEKGIVYI